MTNDKLDLLVIGAGPGGYPAAIRAAQLGAKVALVEREQLGGTCLNWGCIPTKALIAGADLAARARAAQALGVTIEGVQADYAAMTAHKDRTVTRLQGGIAALLKANKVELIRGSASFLGPRRIEIATGEGTRFLAAAKTIVATGSTSIVPGFLPNHPRVVESRAFLERGELPKRLLVMGGGYIGCELACMAALLGAEVTLVELLEDILLLLDPDARREVRRAMEKELGIRILTGAPLKTVTADDAAVRGRVGDETVEGDLLLVSVGRRAVTDGLRPERAGLRVGENGAIPVDACNRTNVPGIYAVGDVNGILQLAHAATSQGVIAAEDACGKAPRGNEDIVPGVIFTHPEVATAGLTETAAKAAGRAVRIGRFTYAGLGRALAAGESGGFVKWIADAETDQLLGAQAVGAHATDLIAEAAVAIRAELTAEELGRTVHAHPTFGELWMEAAHAVHGACIHAPPARR